jgi:hypothetical protein
LTQAVCGMISSELDAQPPNAAPSATSPRIRILAVPRPAGIQSQPQVEGKGERAKASREGLGNRPDLIPGTWLSD